MTSNVPKRTLITMMNALSSGVVPRRGLEYIAVGRRKETETFVRDLDDTAAGGGAFRFISGRFGNGKSFMIQMIRNYAMDKGFVVMDADLSIDRRLTGSRKEGLNTYVELVKNMSIRTRPDNGALEPLLQEWIDSAEEAARKELGRDPDDAEIEARLKRSVSGLSTLPYYNDFLKVVMSYYRDSRDGVEDIPALRWLRGEMELKRDVRSKLGIDSVINDSNWYGFIKIWAEFVVGLGYKGLVVFLDEAVVLYKLQNRASRSNNYERLLTMFNDIMQGKSSYLSMYVCGTPEFIEDPNRGLFSYEALKSRLIQGKYENGYDNYLGPVINLRPLTKEEIYVLLRTIRDLHEQRYGYTSGVDDEKLQIYLGTVLSSVSSSMVTPREITRDLISLLDTLHQNPDATFEDLVIGRTVDADRNPDDDLIEDLEI
ncbi:MAG: ATP-binding protein [Candidatus Methanomethylophilaceae archaeon]|nr:ATP-binding protein [Candidatus Methanomethylophilaceae archaeon]MBR4697631.1 ATP-binding protein [Candidatus Methanomethylophilaceae archaeon]MBR6871178.1 ATP-binding protein [Candidatus Methanomethylophilaceae archaeon]